MFKGMIIFAVASFGCTLPHFIYGDQLLHASNVFNGGGMHNELVLPEKNGDDVSITSVVPDLAVNLCYLNDNNSTFFRTDKECEEEVLVEQKAHSQITSVVLIIFAVSLLCAGIGQTAVSTLGIPYIDDNVASRESPIYIGNYYLHIFMYISCIQI